MRAINLFVLTRIIGEGETGLEDKLVLYERLLSDRGKKSENHNKKELEDHNKKEPENHNKKEPEDHNKKKIIDEIKIIRRMVDIFREKRAEDFVYENWFYSFTIPNISKEFDLLKIGLDNKIINIEIKSNRVENEKIEKQLRQNIGYLSHIHKDEKKEIFSFTCMLDKGKLKIFRYDKKLKESSIDELLECAHKIEKARDNNIEDLFRPTDYLISPFNNPEKFIEGRYFLTDQQDKIKKEITDNIKKKKSLYGITGEAGTGKTLLLYDIAKTLSSDEKFSVGIIHCGNLNKGQIYLNDQFKNYNKSISIIDIKQITKGNKKEKLEWLKEHQILCIDEAQRIYSNKLKYILDIFNKEMGIKGIIFSYDPEQKMSKFECGEKIQDILKDNVKEKKLSGNIRTNKEIYYFIKNMLDLNEKHNKEGVYKDIDIVYTPKICEIHRIADFYIKKEYIYIGYTLAKKSSLKEASVDMWHKNNILADYLGRYSFSHSVIGQEFDKVITLIDDNFEYDSNGELQAKEHPYKDFLFRGMLYQNLTRVREKLCIIVFNNKDVFEKLIEIKEKNLLG